MVFTCTRLPLKLNTSVFGCGCSFGFEQNFWRIDGFGQKKARIGGFAYPYSPPSYRRLFSISSAFSYRLLHFWSRVQARLKIYQPDVLPIFHVSCVKSLVDSETQSIAKFLMDLGINSWKRFSIRRLPDHLNDSFSSHQLSWRSEVGFRYKRNA